MARISEINIETAPEAIQKIVADHVAEGHTITAEKRTLLHVLGVVGNGAAVVDEDLLLGGEPEGIKVNAVLFQQVAEVDAAHQAPVGLGDGVLVKISGTLADEAGQLVIQCVGASLHRIEGGSIVQQWLR